MPRRSASSWRWQQKRSVVLWSAEIHVDRVKEQSGGRLVELLDGGYLVALRPEGTNLQRGAGDVVAVV